MNRISLQPIRIRLTLRMTAVYGTLLLVYAGLMALLLLWYLRHSLDSALKEDAELAQHLLWNALEHEIPGDLHQGEIARVERLLELWSMDGRLLYRSGTLEDGVLGGPPGGAELDGALTIRSANSADGLRWRVASVTFNRRDGRAFLRLAVSEEPLYQDIRDGLMIIGLGILPGLVGVALLGHALAYRALRPVDVMTSAANRISAENLSERIPVANARDELGRLAHTLNGLLGRVEGAFGQLQRFTADASHELRTPLTVMRSVGEVGLQEARTAGDYRDVIGSMLEENARLTHLVDSLLFLSRGESGKMVMDLRPVRLQPLLATVTDMIGILAEERGQSISVECTPGLTVLADDVRCRQAVINLLDNAVKFSPPGSPILVRARASGASLVVIDVIDRGPGVPPGERQRVFDRFFRIPTGAAGERGAGLGLAIVRMSIEAMHGSVEVAEDGPPGATFRITLPRSS